MNTEFEIDLRKPLLSIISKWKWILGLTLLVAIAALVISLLTPDKFEATAMIAVTRPRYIANFDPRFQTVDPSLTVTKAYLDLANNDEVIQMIYNQWSDPAKQNMRLDDFRKDVAKASLGNDPTVINLTIVSKDANESVRLANLWADEFTQRANSIYSGQDSSQLEIFNSQLSDSRQTLQKAEQALVDFQKQNEIQVLTNQINSLLSGQSETLTWQRTIRRAQDDGRSLLKQIDSLAADSKIDSVNALSWTILRSRYYSESPATSSTSNDIQLQIPAINSNEAVTVAEQKKSLTDWIAALDQQYQASQDSLNGLEAKITDLQSRIQNWQNEQKQLELERDLASETFTTLSRKTEEVQISLQDQSGDVRVAGHAIKPNKPSSKNVVQNVLIGAVLGLILASFGVVVQNLWRTSSKLTIKEN